MNAAPLVGFCRAFYRSLRCMEQDHGHQGECPGPSEPAERPMDLSRTPLYQMITQRMGWLTERQRVIAQNVANADTPGYQTRDLRRSISGACCRACASISRPRRPMATISRRARARATATASAPAVRDTMSGNSVSLEREMTKAADSAVDYQLVTNIYRRQLNMLRTVIGRGGGQ